MPCFVLLLWLLLWLLPSGQIQAQPTTAYGDTGAIEALVSELIVNSKKGPVLSLRNVKINGRSNQLITHTGGAVELSFDYKVHCKHCRWGKHQLLLGLHLQHSAQACVKLHRRQSKWKSTKVLIAMPHYPGNYYIRARHSAAFNCTDALDWWRFDQPLGPGSQANIGRVQIIRPQNITHASPTASLP